MKYYSSNTFPTGTINANKTQKSTGGSTSELGFEVKPSGSFFVVTGPPSVVKECVNNNIVDDTLNEAIKINQKNFL